MSRFLAVLYGLVAYLVFFVTFLYAVAFVGDFWVPRTIDQGGPSGTTGSAWLVNLALLGLFALQHSGMARPGFKQWWTRIVPRPVERSTYVLLSSLVLILLFWQWRPLPTTVWEITHPVGAGLLWGLFALGWGIVLISTFLISHFELFGLQQVWLHWRQRTAEPFPLMKRGLYKFVRHPIMLGFVIAFWATPHMTVGHLLFAVMTTAYIVVGTKLEERDLVSAHGTAYVEYRREVSMLVPRPRRGTGQGGEPGRV